MNMKNTIILLFSAITLANCQEGHPAKFTVQIKDDAGTPLPSYPVHIGTLDRAASMKKNEEIWTDSAMSTGADGRVTFDTRSETGLIGINFVQGLPSGYYLTTIPNYRFQRVENGRWTPENPLIEVVLKRKLKPIPMYAKSYVSGASQNLWPPSVGREYGFDFQAGDWVVPTGSEKTKDILFKLEYEKSSTGDYKQLIRVSFPNKGDGLVAFDGLVGTTTDYLTLRSDHCAPVDGYQPVVELHRTSTNKVIKDDANPDRNYYFRVRTKLDADGRVVSAHYGKIYGDFMSFIYYFNPIPNDRNVEYDPKRNLFVPEGKPFYQWPAQYRVTRP